MLPAIALSVRQPWAWAIVAGLKDIENRSTAFRSCRVAVHASKGMTRDEYEDAREHMARLGIDCPRPDELPRGAIVGAVTVTAVVDRSASPWFFGPRGLVLADAVSVHPIPASGALGYFPWTEGGALAEPLKWMAAWPGTWLTTPRPTTTARASTASTRARPRRAAQDVLAERQRQVAVEGWTPEHDDAHGKGQIAAAAGCYALFSDAYPNEGQPPPDWPWDAKWWKPRDYRRDLVRAAALLLAEIERLDRGVAKGE